MNIDNFLNHDFEHVNLGDKRLNRRCQMVAQQLGHNPDESIPRACGTWNETKNAYRFFENEQVEREVLLEPHFQATADRCEAYSEVLAIQDTTYLSLTHHPGTKGLGHIGTHPGLRGLVVHHTLMVDPVSGANLGLMEQQVWTRPTRKRHPKDETCQQRRGRERESQCWERSVEAVLARHLKVRTIFVMDREADIYEVMARLLHENQGFVIRASRNRALSGEWGYLWTAIAHGAEVGVMELQIPARGGRPKRTALLHIRCTTVTINPPRALNRQGEKLTVGVVQAYEAHAPKGVTPLDWALLTNEPIETLSDCLRVIQIYTRRWEIEEFHLGLKTGCQVEGRQFETRQRMEAFLGMSSVIAIMLLHLRDLARGRVSGDHGLTESQLALLKERYPDLGEAPSNYHIMRAVARLGGFLARKGDGEPGWRTLWHGMFDLLLMERGYKLAHSNILYINKGNSSPTCG